MPPKPRGRPVDPTKTDAILDAARAIFVAQGLAGLSIESVAAMAGVSKVTIYRQFSDRAGLLAALVARESRWMETALSALPEGALADSLAAWAAVQMAFLTRPDVRAFDARIAAEATAAPEAAQAVFAAGPARLHAALSARLAAAMPDDLAPGDPGQAAALLMAMLWSTEPPDQTRGLAPPPNLADRAARAQRAIVRFLTLWPLER